MVLIKERVGKLIEQIEELIVTDSKQIKDYQIKNEKGHWKKFNDDLVWGGIRQHFYFRTTIEIPEEFQGKTVIYELKTGREGEWDAVNPQFLVTLNGEIKQGLDVNHRTILLTEKAAKHEKFVLELHSYTGESNYNLILDSAIKVIDRKIEKYYYDIKTAYDVLRLIPQDSEDAVFTLKALNESLNLLDLRVAYSKEFYESLEAADKYFEENYFAKTNIESPIVYCVGHTHIDVAWLWTLATTRDKSVRSFSTVLELMDRYPQYIFMSSQPQLYKYVKEQAPSVYERIKKKVEEGRWETEGGMFVEADCNLASGESLVRQFLYGKDFFKREFGKDNQILWLPDVFGYSAALPQIMKKCGIKYFMTTKISWNEFNKMPHDTFLWKGIDGTEILTHFIPTRDYNKPAQESGTETEHFTTYNGFLTPSQVKGAWQRYSDKDLNSSVLMSYGYGDGGGGPTIEMLETEKRLSRGLKGLPKTEQTTALQFFEKLENEVKDNKYLAKWIGELYLEYHRGTYTSIARNKKYNRKAEFLMENVELFSLISKQLLDLDYPAEEIDEAWEVVLRNQFHDILPGSSIKEVYDDSKAEYEALFEKENKTVNTALEKLVENLSAKKGDVVVFNPNSAEGLSVIEIPEIPGCDSNDNYLLQSDDLIYPLQKTDKGFVAVADAPKQKGYHTYKVVKEAIAATKEIQISKSGVETPYFSIKFDEKMHFVSIYDKTAKREIIPEGKVANEIISYENKPHNFDAWDINNYYTEKSWPVDDVDEVEIVENGSVRAVIKIRRKYLSSVIEQYIYFYKDLRRIDIRNEIDWKEDQILLRDYFPVDVNSSQADFEIQYGNVKRPTHKNTSWDFAKFEVCVHKWFDIAEEGYGVAFINDCKYGCSVDENVAGLTMLKTARYPNPEGDKEHHSFSYSIVPHEGNYVDAKIVDKAYEFNNPLIAFVKNNEGGSLPTEYNFVETDSDNVKIEVVKQALHSDNTIVRLYECHNSRSNARIKFARNIRKAYICNMLEEKEKELEIENGNEINIDFKPFEIVTLLVE